MKRQAAYSRQIAGLLALAVMVGGCETLQRKFTPKHKNVKPPVPVVAFKTYAPTQSAGELYQHNLQLWDFWNGELVDGFGVSEKKVKHASQESLALLLDLQRFLPDEKAGQMQPLIDEHRRLDQRIQRGDLNDSVSQTLKRQFEYQQREVHRRFSPEHMKDHLHLPDTNAPTPGPEPPP